MVQTRRERKATSEIKLVQPDRSGPSDKTLLDIALERDLFQQADQDPRNRNKPDEDNVNEDEALPPLAERIMDTLLWTVSLTMMHFTLDVLVHNQYAASYTFTEITLRALTAFGVFVVLFYVLHRHPTSPVLLPGLPLRFQDSLRQAIFFVTSTVAGCYLIHVSSTYSYLAVMKQSPPIGCLWVWSVIELRLSMAVPSLAIAAAYFYRGGYSLAL
ncbi:hypothetical protein F5Y16DRAFT_224251 [Xylariaceae sp. FL0255]|nr:hypothetical protein F5Y16DRAFT_224251 [Xylariaceae sp. FL0255]